MTDKQTQAAAPGTNMEKDPADWVTGDEAMTGAQHSYLKTLSEEAGVEFDPTLTKAHASKRIDELQALTGRGAGGHPKAGNAPEPETSEGGEEDPGAAVDDPAVRRAMQGEAHAAAHPPARPASTAKTGR